MGAMSNSQTQLDRIEAMLRDVIASINNSKSASRGRVPRAADPRADLTKDRVGELERIFWRIVNAEPSARRNAYHLPKALLTRSSLPTLEAVPVSVLINQCSLRKVFKQKAMGDPMGEEPSACARRLLDQSNLVLLPFNQSQLDSESRTLIAFSPGEARRVAHPGVRIPQIKGWTTHERHEAHISEETNRPAPVPEDPCGPRVWDGVGDVEVEEEPAWTPKQEAIRQRVDFSGDDDDEVDFQEKIFGKRQPVDAEEAAYLAEKRKFAVKVSLNPRVQFGSENED